MTIAGASIEASRGKYAPLMEAFTFQPGFELKDVNVFKDFKVIATRFSVKATL
jgi:hypothetical protein